MSFHVDTDQAKEIAEWRLNHNCRFRNEDGSLKYIGAIGGLTTYSFTPTSIGLIVSAECGCGEKIDVTGDL